MHWQDLKPLMPIIQTGNAYDFFFFSFLPERGLRSPHKQKAAIFGLMSGDRCGIFRIRGMERTWFFLLGILCYDIHAFRAAIRKECGVSDGLESRLICTFFTESA